MRMATALLAMGMVPMAALADDLSGTYVEARTASVFAGACHFNGEYDTAGRKATLAFQFEKGACNGTALAGVNVVVSVASEKNLVIPGVPHMSVVYVDAAATPAQRAAAIEAVREHCAGVIGKVVATKVVPITFERTAKGFEVKAGKEVSLVVHELPDRACCNMPSNVWYEPFAKVQGRMVGRTIQYTVNDAALPTTWSRSDENGAFYGRFVLGGTELAVK